MESCPVCLESLIGKNIFTTKCGHKFCAHCILNNSNYAETCPICRTNLDLQINLESRSDNATNISTTDNRDRFYINNNRVMRVLNVDKTLDYLQRHVSTISRVNQMIFLNELKELFDSVLNENDTITIDSRISQILQRNIAHLVNGNLINSFHDFIRDEVFTYLNNEVSNLEINGRIDDILNNLDN